MPASVLDAHEQERLAVDVDGRGVEDGVDLVRPAADFQDRIGVVSLEQLHACPPLPSARCRQRRPTSLDGPSMIGIAIERIGDEPIVPYGAVPGYGPIFNAGAVFHDGRFHLFARGVRDHYRRNDGPRRALPRLRLGHPRVHLPRRAPRTSSSRCSPRARRTASTPTRTRASTSSAPARTSTSSCPTRTCPRPRRTSSGGSACTGSATPTAASRSTERRDRWSGPPGEPDKDGIVFNLRDGRVALIHRIYPNMQLAVFDSLDAAVGPPGRLLGGAHGGPRPPHDHPPARRLLSASAPARRRS